MLIKHDLSVDVKARVQSPCFGQMTTGYFINTFITFVASYYEI